MDPNNALSKKNQSSITIAIIGPYNWLPGLSYNRYEVVGGYDNLNVKKYSDLSQWNYDSWWFFNQVAITLAIESINNDTSILPNTTIRIRRFRNNRNPLGYADGPTGIALSYEIATRYPDVVAVVGDFFSTDMIGSGEVYSYFKLPMCTGSAVSPPLLNRFNYPYYLQSIPLSGFAESIALTLESWQVKRVALIDTRSFSNSGSYCGYIGSVLEQRGFSILARITFKGSSALDYTAESLARVDARYIILCSDPTTSNYIYYTLAHRQQFVGKDYVWFMLNTPSSGGTGQALLGSEYYTYGRGIMKVFGANQMNSNMSQQATKLLTAVNSLQRLKGVLVPFSFTDIQRFNMMQLYDCPKIIAAGITNLLNSDSNKTTSMLSKRELQEYLNFTQFKNTGYRGMIGDPVQLSNGGDLAATFFASYLDGSKGQAMKAFAITDLNVTRIDALNGSAPIFFDGTSSPPLDGPIYTTKLISPSSPSGKLLFFFSISGIILGMLFFLVVQIFKKTTVIRTGSTIFLSLLALGALPSYSANILHIGMPNVIKCRWIMWLQLMSFSLITSALICKNLRVSVIYGSLAILPKYLLHNEIWVAMFMCLFVIELALLGAWTTLSKAAVIKTDLIGNVSIYQCQFTETVVGKIMWSYNCILIVGLVTVTYMSRKISSEHSEFSLLLIISVCITVSALLIGNLDKSELDYEIKSAALVYINTTAPLIMQAIPRIFVLLQTEVIPDMNRRLSTLTMRDSQGSSNRKSSTAAPPSRKVSAMSLSPMVNVRGSRNRSSSAVQQLLAPSTAGKQVKFSKVFPVSYSGQRRDRWWTDSWTEGIVAIGIVRSNIYLQFIPPRHNLELAPYAFSLGGQFKVDHELVFFNGIPGIQYDRIEICSQSLHRKIYVDFLNDGSGSEFRDLLLTYLDYKR